MKRLIVFCFWMLGVSAGVLAQTSNPYWTEVLTPDGGGNAEIFLTNDSTLYNYSSMGGPVYRSTDLGLNWVKLNIPTWGTDSTFIVGTTGNLYMTRRTSSGLFALERSLDLGNTWILVNANIPSRNLVETRGESLVVYTKNQIHRSTDGGLSWNLVSNTGVQSSVELWSGLLVDWGNSTTKIGTMSTDDGLTWSTFNVNLPVNNGSFGHVAISADTLLAFRGGVAYRTFNRGTKWDSTVVLGSFSYIKSMIALPTGRMLVLQPDGKMSVSDDLGATWMFPAPVSGRWPTFFSLVLPNGNIVARDGFKGGSIWQSSDGGISWVFSSKGINLASIRHLEFIGDSSILATTSDGVSITSDQGKHWNYLLTEGKSTSTAFVPATQTSAFNADTFIVFINYRLLLTLNGGNSFADIVPIGSNGYFFDPKTRQILSTSSFSLTVSYDLGATWVSKAPIGVLNIVRHPAGLLLGLDGSSTRILRSNDDGSTWEDITPPSFSQKCYPVAVNSEGDICAYGMTQNGTDLMAVSRDGGNTWEEHRSATNIENYEPAIFDINSLGNIYLAFDSEVNPQKFACSLNNGDSWFLLPIPTGYAIAGDPTLFVSPSNYLYITGNNALYRTTNSTLLGGYLRGQVQKDGDADCSTPDAQDPLRWPVKIEGEQTYYALPSLAGTYEVFVADTGTYQVSAQQPHAVWWELCDDTKTAHLDMFLAADTANFSGSALMECPLMQVDVAAFRLRRCLNNLVFVQYCNIGTEPADSAWVEIELDPYLTLVSTPTPYDSLGPKHFRFNVGSMQPEECGQFQFLVYVDCDSTILGQTHCILAHAWPDTLCAPVNGWSGANIEAEAHCIGDSTVRLILRNTGTGASSMLEYIIIEDDIVLLQGDEIYDIGEDIVIERPAQGRTWRIESQQEPGHPFSNLAIAFTEGCDGFNSLGFINQFAVNGIRPAWDRFCLENTGAYDPNDKQGFPLGHGSDQRIRPGQDLEYLIRFQNTGTDTAFTVVIRDTLSTWLDAASVRPGAASHPYTWDLSGQGVLTFRFNNILLPDSNTNLAASQGFVNFRVEQQPNVPLGTKIFNEANIYFDFNAPIVTNQTLHTIGLNLSSSTSDLPPTSPTDAVLISPNPVEESTVFRLREGVFQQHLLTLTDAVGRTVWQSRVTGSHHVFNRKNLPAGVYACRVEDVRGRLTGSGKVVLK